MCSDGQDCYEPGQPYLFGSALDDAEREDEAREKRDERNLCCGVCNGSGEGMHDGTKCRKCGGSGTLEKWPKRKQEAEEVSEQFKLVTQTTWTPINVNAQCEVTLTDFGVTHLESIKGRCYCGVYEGTRIVRASLWAIMHDFGPAHVFGSTQIPFVDNAIFVRAE